MSDTLVEASAGDRKDGQPEALNVETAQPSLLKKGGLFGNSAAKVGDGSPSPASQNGAEASSQNKNGDSDSGANGDEADLEGANGDSTGNDETMPIDEPPADEIEAAAAADEDEEEDKPVDEVAAPAAAAGDEQAPVVALPAEVMEDIEMAEDTDEEAAEVESVDGKGEEKKDEKEKEEDEEEKEATVPAAAVKDSEEEEEEEPVEEKKEDVVVVPAEDDEDEDMEKEEEEEVEEVKEEEEEEPKEEEQPAAEEEKDETAAEEKEEEEKEEQEEVEEECVKKVISMDTDETADEPAEAAAAAVVDEEEAAEADEVADETAATAAAAFTPVATPKRGRGRPPKSASGTPAAPQKTPTTTRKTPSATAKKTPAAAPDAAIDEQGDSATEESSPSKQRTPRGAAKRANQALASSPRGRRSLKSETSSSQADAAGEEEQKEGDEEEAAEGMKTPPSTGRGRRSVKTTPASAPRTARGRRIAEEIEDIEEEDPREEEEEKEEGDKEEAKEEEAVATPKRGRRSQATTTPATAKKAEEQSVSPARRSTRGGVGAGSKSPAKTPAAAPKPTPKGRGRRSSVKSEETVETEGTEDTEEKEAAGGDEEEEEKPRRRGRPGARKSGPSKTPTASAKKAKKAAEDEEDPFDMDTELDKHPEPLRNITVEKGSFGEMKYTRSPAASKSKYAATERSAEEKVGNLPNTPAATGAPKTIASAQSTRKSLGGSPAKRTPAAKRGKRGGEEEGDEEMMEEDDEGAAMETPQERKGRGRPAGGSTGRKRKASPTVATSAKRAAVCVTIPELDAESQWSADHPEDDSAPLVPGARVFAVFQKVFYPALVGERDGLGRYMVEFVEDKIVRPVPPAGVVPLSAVTIDKECLYQSSPDADPVYCRVLRSANAANARDWLEGAFRLVEMGGDEAEHDACWTSLQLDMATTEWKKYVNAKSKMVTRINTDNITSLEDRRERRSRVHNDTAVALATLTSGGTPEPSARRVAGARKTPSASASATAAAKPASAKTASGGRRGRKPKAAAAAAAAAEDEAGDEEEEEKAELKEKEKEEKMEVDEKDGGKEERKKEMNPRIFLNKTFILTSANRITTDVVFRKNEMKKQILERGGIVVEDINQVPLDAEAYLISDTHYRTHKYLAAMSRGMPCLSHKWLIECVSQEELLPYDAHKLAGGQGLLNGDLYPLPDVRGKLLVGRSIMVHSKTDTTSKRGTMGFKQIWSPIVELLGARVVPDACLVDVTTAEQAAKIALPADFEILLTDSSCQPEVVAKLEAAGKAVVSSEWLIQSIIMGVCPDFTAHPRFRYDSGNEPTKKEGSQDKSQS